MVPDAGHQSDHSSLAVDNPPHPLGQGRLAAVTVDEQQLCVGIGLAESLGVDLVAVTEVVDQPGLVSLMGIERGTVNQVAHDILTELPAAGDSIYDLFEQGTDDPGSGLPLRLGERALEENVGGVFVLVASGDLAPYA